LKRAGYLFEDICSFDNLYKAFKKAIKGSGKTQDACWFHFNLEKELLILKERLETGSYHPARYRYFKIFDPKERIISVAPFRDRVVHHALVQTLEPVIDRTFIYDSYATRKGKGTHRAIKRAKRFLKNNYYYLKTDIAKYFDSIDHDILLNLVEKKVKDKKALLLVERIIRNSDTSRGLEAGKGLPIGNLTSQFFANVYLDPLDHFLKDNSGVKRYIRYMDDMVVFSSSKEYLKGILRDMETFLADCLRLALNPRAMSLNSRIHGLPFLGFRVFPNLIRIKQENLQRMKRRMQKRMVEFKKGLILEEKFVMSMRSMFEHMGFADSYRLRSLISLNT